MGRTIIILFGCGIFFFVFRGVVASQSDWLTDLHGPEAIQLKKEITINLKSGVQQHRLAIPLRFMRYKLKKGDHFYFIATKLSQDPDTLASLNNLASADELKQGDVILVPNARGVFREPNEADLGTPSIQVKVPNLLKQLSIKKVSSSKLVETSFDFKFYPGRRFDTAERNFFKGVVFRHPLPGARKSSDFGWRKDPIHGRSSFHGGIDLAAPVGTQVSAASPGEVIFAGNRGGYGKAVLVRHQYGYVTLYGHLSKIFIKKGQKVDAGELIASVGKTGRVTGPHLHFELLKEGKQRMPIFDRKHR